MTFRQPETQEWLVPAALRLSLAWGLVFSASVGGLAQQNAADLTQASLEDLMNIRVTSVAKKEQPLAKAGAAVFVITAEDIRRSGLMNIPDVLRMAPGVEVARIDANAWAISIRGFNFRYSTKVLVLIDGRTVYTPLFSGVLWDQQDVPLEDIERIEVIRGPGGTVWGANAVNGVINIITKNSKDTQGGLITAGTGSEDSADGLTQFGGKAGKKGHYRVFGRYFKVESSGVGLTGADPGDGWHGSHGGFRSDWDLSGKDRLTVQGDLFGTSEGQTIKTVFSDHLPDLYTIHDHVTVASGNLLGRWSHVFANGSETAVQAYYDRYHRLDQGDNVLNTGDLDIQYHFHAGSRHDIVAGAGYRATDQSYLRGYELAFGTGHRRDSLFNTFLQDEVRLTNSLALTIGSKFEHNAYTGFEYEPGAQLVWTPNARQTVWFSTVRAIQQPSWFYAEARLDAATFPLEGGGFGEVEVQGSPNAKATILNDFELGHRAELTKRFSVDTVAFGSYYRRVITAEPAAPFFELDATPHLVFPQVSANLAHARNYGAEIFLNWQVTNRWRISPGFSFLQMKITRDATSQDAAIEASVGDSPKRRAGLRSMWNLPHNLEFDTSVYYVGALRLGPVSSYTRLDTRFGWRVNESVELSVAGQNLLTPGHVEFFDANQVIPTQVERSVSGKIAWHF